MRCVPCRRQGVKFAGRPEATTHAAIELFRYYASKNDLRWGQVTDTPTGFADLLRDGSPDEPLRDAVYRAVIGFNTFPTNAMPSQRDRMRLMLTSPALQAHSAVGYAEWRRVVAEYVANRCGTPPEDLFPEVV